MRFKEKSPIAENFHRESIFSLVEQSREITAIVKPALGRSAREVMPKVGGTSRGLPPVDIEQIIVRSHPGLDLHRLLIEDDFLAQKAAG